MEKHDPRVSTVTGGDRPVDSAIIRYSTNAIISVTPQSIINSWNPAAEKMYGYTPEEAIGKPITLIFPPDRIDEEKEFLTRLSRGEEIPTYETRRVRKDGVEIEISLSLSPVKDSSGKVTGSSRIAVDITETKRARIELEQAHARYKATLDNMMEGGQIIDKEWRYVYINDVAAAHGRVTREQLLGRKMTDVYPGIENTEMFARVRDCLEHGTSCKMGNSFLYPDGSTAWFNLSIEPVVEGAFILSIDVTEEKKMIEELRTNREGLERLVRMRTGKLEEANRELEAFSYSVSHDLRAPLRHIDGFVDLLRKHAGETLDEKGKRYLHVISDSARTMGTLIDELLVFSRMGRNEMRESKVDTAGMVGQLVAGFMEDAQGREINIHVGPLPDVHADPSMLRLVFENLLSNAVKYTSKTPEAEVSVGSRAENGEIIFFVRDNGVGFDMKYSDKLFGVFQRLHRQEDFEGVGIGLANVRRIIARHGGRTWAESKPGLGATFYFSLPFKTMESVNE